MTKPINLTEVLERMQSLDVNGLMPTKMTYEKMGQLVSAVEPSYHRFCDMRGWGYLTGGAACNLDADDAASIQDARGELVAMLPNIITAFEASMALNKQLVGVLGNIKRINENALLAGASRADIQEFSRKKADAAIYAAQAHGIKE